MENGLVTVVLPIYNVEAYLERNIKSVINQTYKKLEIILVDDGSPDNCPEICEEWAKKDKRIKVIHKKNAGLGCARNTGIENATGEYICFFDSDDYIDLDAIEKAYTLAKNENSDIVTFGFSTVKSDGTIGNSIIPKTDKVTYEGKEVQETFLADLIGPDCSTGKQTNLWMSAWASLYSMKIITENNWRFVSEREIISEDIYSLLGLYKYVNRVSVLSEALYYYCENEGSLTHTYKDNRYTQIKRFYDECIKLCKQQGYNESVMERIAYPYLSNTISAMKMLVSADINKKEKKTLLKIIINDNHLQMVLKKINLKKEKKVRKIILILIKNKMCNICYLLMKVKGN